MFCPLFSSWLWIIMVYSLFLRCLVINSWTYYIFELVHFQCLEEKQVPTCTNPRLQIASPPNPTVSPPSQKKIPSFYFRWPYTSKGVAFDPPQWSFTRIQPDVLVIWHFIFCGHDRLAPHRLSSWPYTLGICRYTFHMGVTYISHVEPRAKACLTLFSSGLQHLYKHLSRSILKGKLHPNT